MSKKYPPRSTAKQQLLSNDDFLTSLTTLLSNNKTGSIYLTQKLMPSEFTTPSLTDHTIEDLTDSLRPDPEVLFRARDRKSVKISTRVSAGKVAAFMAQYADLCRAGMGAGLKKRDRKKSKKVVE